MLWVYNPILVTCQVVSIILTLRGLVAGTGSGNVCTCFMDPSPTVWP